MTDELKQLEEAKRERNWDLHMRLKVLQATITWAESQIKVNRNTPANRLEEQSRKLAEMQSSRLRSD